jgi:WS/DGAT/MGAT family acyltransferase
MAEFMSGVDAAWWHIDRPTNIAMIVGIMTFDTPIERSRLIKVFSERMLIHDRFRQRVREPLLGLGLPRWEFDPHFNLDYHLPSVRLPEPAGQTELQNLASQLMSQPLDPDRPLWQVYYVENYQGGSALIGRLHHCIADGLALVQVLLSLTDEQAQPFAAGQADRDAAGRSGRGLRGPLAQLIDTASTTARGLALESLITLTQPARVTQVLSLGALGVDAASKLLLLPPDTPTPLAGKCGVEKRVAWSGAIPLAMVKQAGHILGGTINDVLLTVATGALRRYLGRRDHPVAGLNVRAMVPVSVRAAKDLHKLGNQFGLVILSLPVGVRDAAARLQVLKQRMDEIKSSPEAWVAFGLLSVMGVTPTQIERLLVDFFAAKTSAVMTNVPGPSQPLYLAGQRLRSLMFWVPRAGNIGLGLSILSYAGDVYIGVATDAGLVPDPQTLVDDFHAELTDLLAAAAPVKVTVRRSLPARSVSTGTSAAAALAVVKVPQPNGHCQALTKTGKPCRNRPLPESFYCAVHAKQPQISA